MFGFRKMLQHRNIQMLQNNNENLEQNVETLTEKLVKNNKKKWKLKQALWETEYTAKEAVGLRILFFSLKVSIMITRKQFTIVQSLPYLELHKH